jgi:hypothetical protein
MAQWYVHAHSGQRYGPIEREELDRWVNEGRLTPRCQVWMDGWPEWRLAPEIFPQVTAQTQQSTGGPAQPTANMGQAAGSPYASPVMSSHMRQGPQGAGRPMLPDRSVLVFVFGLLGLIIWCSFLGIPAWIMGSKDLKDIDAGLRDPSGRGLTQAGMILGIIASIIVILVLGFYGFVICAGVAGGL